MNLADLTWYAVMTNSREEQLAARDIEYRGYQSLFLHISEHKLDSKRSWLVKRPYLPRYIFVGLGPEHFVGGVPILAPINRARGVATVVRSPGGEPFPIPLRAMELVTDKAELPGGLVWSDKPLPKFAGRPGDTVRLSDASAYQGLMASILRVDPRGQIIVELQSFGRMVPTRIGLEDVDQLIDRDGCILDKCEPSRTETSAS